MGDEPLLRKVNRTSQKTDILNQAIGEILKSNNTKNRSSPGNKNYRSRKSSSAFKAMPDDDVMDADVEDELDEDEDYSDLKIKKAKKKMSLQNATAKDPKKTVKGTLFTSESCASSAEAIKQAMTEVKQSAGDKNKSQQQPPNNKSQTKKKQSPVEVISSSYTLKPVYRRAAASKASDKIAKEAAKSRLEGGTNKKRKGTKKRKDKEKRKDKKKKKEKEKRKNKD